MDIVTRLRDRAYSGKVPDKLCEEAAREIEMLRKEVKNDAIAASLDLAELFSKASDAIRRMQLTEEEREAIAVAMSTAVDTPHYRTLQGLLARLQGS